MLEFSGEDINLRKSVCFLRRSACWAQSERALINIASRDAKYACFKVKTSCDMIFFGVFVGIWWPKDRIT